MAKKTTKAAAAAAIEITRHCTRDRSGFGALPGLGISDGDTLERAEVSALKARLLAAGFESLEVSFVEHLAGMEDGDDKDTLSDCWEDGDCLGWVPAAEGAGWTLVAVVFVDGKIASGEGDDAVAVFARPAGMVDQAPALTPVKAWPFPKTEGGGPDASSTQGEQDEQPPEPSAVPDLPACTGSQTVAAQPGAMTKADARLGRKSAQFELLEPTDALLKTFTPRVEKHGDDDVSAASLGLQIEAPNTILDLLSPSLRRTLYAAPEGQTTLPGVEESTPLLRTKVIDTVKLTNSYEGWLVRISRGMDDTIDISGCKVDKFVVTPRDGGSVQLDLRIGSSDIDEEEAGWLYGHLRHDIEITLHAPQAKPEAIDGSVAAFQADHPDAEQPDAGDLFAAAHGGDDTADGGSDERVATDDSDDAGIADELDEEGAES